MTQACDHQRQRLAAGLPADWRDRLEAARAVIAGADHTARDAVAEAWLVVIELEVARAGFELRASPEAEAALRSLALLVGDAEDAGLRTRLAFALLAIGRARRIPASRGRAKVEAEATAIEGALVIAERTPVLEAVVATCLAALVKTGHFQTEPAAARTLRERFGRTRSPAVAAAAADGLDAWATMLPKGDATRAELIAERDALLLLSRR